MIWLLFKASVLHLLHSAPSLCGVPCNICLIHFYHPVFTGISLSWVSSPFWWWSLLTNLRFASSFHFYHLRYFPLQVTEDLDQIRLMWYTNLLSDVTRNSEIGKTQAWDIEFLVLVSQVLLVLSLMCWHYNQDGSNMASAVLGPFWYDSEEPKRELFFCYFLFRREELFLGPSLKPDCHRSPWLELGCTLIPKSIIRNRNGATPMAETH